MISISDLTKTYKDRKVIDGLSLELPEKGTVKISGKSGSGKTTLLHIIAGLVEPDSGEVSVSGSMSMVFQEDRLIMSKSVLENVMLVCGGDQKEGRSPEGILTELGLGNELDTRVSELSGGMARRVAIARALSRDADIYLMDEPIRGLDEETAQAARSVILKYTKDRLLVVVSHDPGEFDSPDISVSIN